MMMMVVVLVLLLLVVLVIVNVAGYSYRWRNGRARVPRGGACLLMLIAEMVVV